MHSLTPEYSPGGAGGWINPRSLRNLFSCRAVKPELLSVQFIQVHVPPPLHTGEAQNGLGQGKWTQYANDGEIDNLLYDNDEIYEDENVNGTDKHFFGNGQPLTDQYFIDKKKR